MNRAGLPAIHSNGGRKVAQEPVQKCAGERFGNGFGNMCRLKPELAAVLVHKERHAHGSPAWTGVINGLDRSAAELVAQRVQRSKVGVPQRRAVSEQQFEDPTCLPWTPAEVRRHLEYTEVDI